jgi:hypothetical protein
MKRIFPLTLVVILAACAPLQPGADPIVVNAERTANVASDTFDTFLKLEYDNRAALLTLSPEIHKYAEVLREKAPTWLASLRALTKAYKFNRSSENKASLQTAISVVTAAMQESSKYIGQINKSAATTP